MAARFLTYLLPLLSVGYCSPTPRLTPRANVKLPLSNHIVAQFSAIPTWLENIAIRANGDILVTQYLPAPSVYTIKNPTAKGAAFDLVHTWTEPNAVRLFGIAETTPDTFVVLSGNTTLTATGFPGTFSTWEMKFSGASSTPSVRKITDIPEAKFLNGAIAVPTDPTVVLIADSQYGLLFRLDTISGKYEMIADRPEFKAVAGGLVAIGINGVRISNGYLYFSNSNTVKIYRVPITPDGYLADNGNAAISVYADMNSVTTFVDDFAFAADGTIYAVANMANTLTAIAPGGKTVVNVVGATDQMTVAGDTGAFFGRTPADKQTLYVTTVGAVAAPVNGTLTEPGKVVAVDTSSFHW